LKNSTAIFKAIQIKRDNPIFKALLKFCTVTSKTFSDIKKSYKLPSVGGFAD